MVQKLEKLTKKLVRAMEKELKEAGVTKKEMGGLERYIPKTVMYDDGEVHAFVQNAGSGYNSLTDAVKDGSLTSDYTDSLLYFRNDLQGIIQQRAEAVKEARINKAVDDLMGKFGV